MYSFQFLKKTKTYRFKNLSLLIAAIFAFMSIFGVFISMNTNTHGGMSDCPFSSQSSNFCPMTWAEHLTKWQLLFSADPQIKLLTITVLVLAFVLAIFKVSTKINSQLIAHWYKYYKREHPDSNLYNYFLHLISSGILQPKLYA